MFDDAQCQNEVGTAVQPAVNQCGSLAPPSGTKAFLANPPTANAGACTPGGGAKTVPPPKWARAGLACVGGGLGGGCGAGKLCTGKPAPPFVAGLCVWHTGDFPCPTGFADKHTFTDTVVDTRDCTGCSCGAPNAACTATTGIYSNGSCNGAPLSVPDDGSCVQLVGNAGSIDVTVTGSASCPPSGGQPVGSIVAGAVKTTVCCAM
jgi:hypothetical protein